MNKVYPAFGVGQESRPSTGAMTLQEAISQIPCFQSLTPHQRQDLERLCSLQKCAAGETIFTYGQDGNALYFVADGQVEIFTSNNAGEKLHLETNGVGNVFGEVAVLDGATRTANAAASAATALVCLPGEHREAAQMLCPGLSELLLQRMAQRLRNSGDALRHWTTFDINKLIEEELSTFDRICRGAVEILGSATFLTLLTCGVVLWICFKPFHDTDFNTLSLAISIVSMMVSQFVLLSQKREEKVSRVRNRAESEAIQNTAKELAYLHEKLDSLTHQLPTTPPSKTP